jgi:hypothetical protein
MTTTNTALADLRGRRERYAIVLLVLTAILAGCADSPSAPRTAASPPGRATSRVISPIDALIPKQSDADARTLWEGQRAMIRQCMRAKGFDYTFASYEENAAREDEATQIAEHASAFASAYANPTWAHAHGYGIDISVLRKQYSMHLGPETGTVLDPKTDAALNGKSSDPVIQVQRTDGTVANMRAGGCFWDAQQKLYGDVRTWLGLWYNVNDLSRDLHQQAMADVAVSTALAQWRSCMGSRGWQNFQQQFDAFSSAVAAYRRNDPKAHKIEFAVAAADAECTVTSHYADAKAASEKRAAQGARAASDSMIIAFTQRQDTAVKAAAKALANS